MENLGQETPILVRRGKKARHEDHGGAWKVAMADFALALMALFLVLWIINNSNEDQREAIAGYFQDPKAFTEGQLAPSSSAINLGGTPAAVNSALMPRDNEADSDQSDRKSRDDLRSQLEQLILANPTLSPFQNQMLIDITSEGLRIQVVDNQDRPLFESGSARLTYFLEDILWELGPVVAATQLNITITGHTDSQSLSGLQGDDGNWLLSAQRADTARRALMESGVRKEQMVQVIGKGDTQPFNRIDPLAPVNRRVAIVLMDPAEVDSSEKQSGIGEDSEPDNARGISSTRSTVEQTQEGKNQQSSWERATRALQRMQEQRNRTDNSYDNPPDF